MSSETSSNLVIEAHGLGKAYRLYHRRRDRLVQALIGRRRKLYHDHWALQPLDLDIARGESVAIVGRNGSGKSTLLQLICGIIAPTCGEATVSGRIAPLLQLGAGFHPEFTGRENVFLSGAVLGLQRGEIEDRFEAIEAFAEIGDFIDQPVKHYSSGMSARLAFAVAAHVDTDILVVDEILAVGDAGFSAKCMRYIRRFREKGTLLLVSHDVSAVLTLCDRAVWLDGGHLRGDGVAKDVCHAYETSLQIRDDVEDDFTSGGSRSEDTATPAIQSDPRRGLLHESKHRNDLELFHFDPDAQHFGYGRAKIEHAELVSIDAGAVGVLHGGEVVELVVSVRAREPVARPIVGFFVKNRYGQELFGDNTFLTYRDRPMPLTEGQHLEARFRFQMPYLPAGDFSIQVAVADGTQEDHAQQHWIEDALFFKVHSTHVARGLVGIPMLNIEIKT